MARQANQIAINIVAHDNASKTIKSVENNVRRMPEAFSKSASALSVLDGALASSGNSALAAAGKLANLGSLVATGGAVGIAIAATTAAIGAASEVMGLYSMESDKAADAQKRLLPVLDAMRVRLEKTKAETEKLVDQFRFWGMASHEVALAQKQELDAAQSRGTAQLQKTVDAQKKAIEADKARLDGLYKQSAALHDGEKRESEYTRALQEKINEQQGWLRINENALHIARESNNEIKEQIALLKDLDIAREQDKQQLVDNAAAQKRAEAAKKRIEYEKMANEEIERLANEHERENNRIAIDAQKERQSRLAALDAANKKRQEAIDAAVEQRNEQHRQKRLAREREEHDLKVTLATASADAISNAFEQIATGDKDAASAMLEATMSIVRTAIMEAAALAAARQFAAVGGWLPGIGILVGGGAAAAMFAAVSAYANRATKMARGGMVTGGLPYSDSVPILAQAGERVLSRDDTVVFNKLIAALDGMQSRGALSGGRGSGSTNINIQTLVPYTPAETARAGKAIVKLSRGR